MELNIPERRPAGYAFLLKKYAINTIPHWHTSSVTLTGIRQMIEDNKSIKDIYPQKYWPGSSTGDHLEFALIYDGVNLCILKLIFDAADETEIIEHIQSKPTGKYAQRIWFFYDQLLFLRIPSAALIPLAQAPVIPRLVPAPSPTRYRSFFA